MAVNGMPRPSLGYSLQVNCWALLGRSFVHGRWDGRMCRRKYIYVRQSRGPQTEARLVVFDGRSPQVHPVCEISIGSKPPLHIRKHFIARQVHRDAPIID